MAWGYSTTSDAGSFWHEVRVIDLFRFGGNRPKRCNAGTNAQYCGFASGLRTGEIGMPKSEEVVAVYHLHAANCTDIARRTSDPKNRLVLLQMAAAWLKL